MAQPVTRRVAPLLRSAGAVGLMGALLGSACIGKIGLDDNAPPAPPTPPTDGVAFQPVAPRVYLAKVKNLMVGQAPTAEEIAAVEKDPAALRAMVDAWFVTPPSQAKLFSFFQKAFQQIQIGAGDYFDQLVDLPSQVQPSSEMFARTAQYLVAQGRPFTETVTTHTFMMTPLLMSQYLAIDQTTVSDNGVMGSDVPRPDGSTSTSFQAYLTYVPPASGGPITFAQLLDPTSPNYLHFPMPAAIPCQVPQVDNTGHVVLDMAGKPVLVNVPYNERNISNARDGWYALFGLGQGAPGKDAPKAPAIPGDVPPEKRYLYQLVGTCGNRFGFTPPLLTADDNVWRPVTIRAPKAGEKLVPFYDLPKLRAANELVLRAPRVGFFTTPAFFANWQTNKSNQARDVLNQTLIVAIGKSINPVDKGTSTVLDTGKDGQHSDPNSPCYSCHQTMDPMRMVFRKFYTYNYHRQQDPAVAFAPATFDFQGKTAPLSTMDDLARTLVEHPLYGGAWAQKLCYYANSSACAEDDPEFQRVVKAFVDSGYDFHALVRELFSSPLITGAARTKTWAEAGETISVARKDHLCTSLTNRLGLATNLCANIGGGAQAQSVATNIPSDGYLRGAEAPALSTDATMFFRGAGETLCQIAADQVVDKPGSRFASAKKDAVITDLVQSVMGLAGDSTAPQAAQILKDHFAAAIAAGASPTDAMKSTFVVACTSPTSLAVGL